MVFGWFLCDFWGSWMDLGVFSLGGSLVGFWVAFFGFLFLGNVVIGFWVISGVLLLLVWVTFMFRPQGLLR